MLKKIVSLGVWLVIGVALLWPNVSAQAAEGVFYLSCFEKGDCTLCDGLRIFVNAINFLLKVSGSLALIMFVYGGLLFVLSQGKSASVEKGKNILIGATIGLLIVLGSYLIVSVILAVATDNSMGVVLEKKWTDLTQSLCKQAKTSN